LRRQWRTRIAITGAGLVPGGYRGRTELGRRGLKSPSRQALERPFSQLIGQHLDPPRTLVSGILNRPDEAFYVEFPFAAQPAVVHRVLVQAPGTFEGAVVQFGAGDVVRGNSAQFVVGSFELHDVPGVQTDAAVAGAGAFDESE